MKSVLFLAVGAVLLIVLTLVLGPGSAAGNGKPETVDGPEATDLIKKISGHLVMDKSGEKAASWGLAAVSLPALEERTVRDAKESVYIHSVSGPDRDGRIAFVQGQLDGDVKDRRFSLRTIRLDGKEELEVFSRRGDPMWYMLAPSVGESLALAPVGGHVAFVGKPKSIHFKNQPFYLAAGPLEVWDVTKKTGGEIDVTAVESGLCWFPDGRRLAYVELLPREKVDLPDALGEFAGDVKKWEKVPAVHILDTHTGKKTFLHVGSRPVVSPDGKTALVESLGRWRLVDIGSGESKAAQWPGNVGPVALVDSKLVLYWGKPTTGTRLRYGPYGHAPHLLLSLKVAEINSGKFQTAVPYIDHHRVVSFGVAPGSR
jgi:hypothetical protein